MFDLRTILRLDAAASGALGVLLLVLPVPARDQLGVPVPLSLSVGVLLLAWAAFVAWVSSHRRRPWVTEVVALNVVYVALSVVLAASDWVALTGLGVGFVLLQATAVLLLTLGQVAALRTGRETVAA